MKYEIEEKRRGMREREQKMKDQEVLIRTLNRR